MAQARLRVWVRHPHTSFGAHRTWADVEDTPEVRRALQIGLLALADADGNPQEPPAAERRGGCGCR